MYKHLPKFVFFFLFSIFLGTVTWVETQPSGHLSRFPRFTTAGRPTCDASRAGHPIWNTTLSEAQVCNGTTYVSFSGAAGGITGTGTATFLPIFTAATTLGDSKISYVAATGFVATLSASETFDFELDAASNAFFVGNLGSGGFNVNREPAAGAGGSIIVMNTTVLAMDNSDTVNLASISTTNANHTGTGNTLNMLSLAAITGDANANLNAINIGALTGTAGAAGELESAIQIGAGWDADLLLASSAAVIRNSVAETSLTFRDSANANQLILNYRTTGAPTRATFGTSGTATLPVGSTLVKLQETLAALDGSDTDDYLNITATIGNPTGTGNTVNLFSTAAVTGDANTNLNAINVGALTGTTGAAGELENAITTGTGWDNDLNLGSGVIRFSSATANVAFNSVNTAALWSLQANNNNVYFWLVSGAGVETSTFMGTDLAIVGAAQNADPPTDVIEVGAAAAADITTLTAPISSSASRITFICKDANLTFTDGGAAGAANTMDLAGSFTCSQDDTITLTFIAAPAAGNARWVEVARSVN